MCVILYYVVNFCPLFSQLACVSPCWYICHVVWSVRALGQKVQNRGSKTTKKGLGWCRRYRDVWRIS